ncbi:MAG: hypothetical protein J3Q66DRAFT_360976 [Benniella sp.]|nr:MAG: hypothetical protein J3Q66DRAFT_360976 [Benniella sp.]
MRSKDAKTMEGESHPQETLSGDTFMPSTANAASDSCGKLILGSDQEPKGPHASALITAAARNAITDMVFYGIGSVESSRNSQFQLALGICLKEILQIPGTMSIFDPVMTGFDMQLAERLGFNVLKANDQAKQVLHARTLLYMPHCPKGLYSHVLESNWSREHLDNLVILGNRFTMYDER